MSVSEKIREWINSPQFPGTAVEIIREFGNDIADVLDMFRDLFTSEDEFVVSGDKVKALDRLGVATDIDVIELDLIDEIVDGGE